jgi:hypothetical protein
MLKGASELGSLWAAFWNEQLTTGMEAMRSLAQSDSWDEALRLQNEFTRGASSGFARGRSRAPRSRQRCSRAASCPCRSRHAEPQSERRGRGRSSSEP